MSQAGGYHWIARLRAVATSPRGAFYLGLLFWAAVAVLGIYLRGIRWEESFERAQALAGIVPYPEGHPLIRFARNAIGFHFYLTALIMRAIPDAVFICGYRSILAALFAILPFYVLGALLSRKVWLGHLTALLGISGIQLVFCSHYGLQVWPDKFTAGTIGQGYAFFVLAAFIARRWRTAFLLLGLMPIVHLGHMPVVLGVGLVAAAWLWGSRSAAWKPACLVFTAALACSVLFILLIKYFSLPPPDSGPFLAERDTVDAWQRFIYYEDIHRAPTATPRFGPFANSVMALVALLLSSAALLRRDWTRGVTTSPFLWIFLYGAGSAAAVVVAKIAQQVWAEETPFLLIGWLPYRSPNLGAILLLPTLVYITALGPTGKNVPWPANLAWLAAAALGLRPLLKVLAPADVYEAYIAPAETAMFFLFGAAAARLWQLLRGDERFRALWATGVALALAALATEHQFGTALVVLGLSVGALSGHLGHLARSPWCLPCRIVVFAGVAVQFGSILVALHQDYTPALEKTPFEQQVAALLREESQPGELLLTPHWHLNWQEKLSQPVFMTFETPQLLTYIPDLAGATEKMMEDAYGIRFGEPWDYSLDAWKSRTRTEWQALGREYGIRFVLSPNGVPLDLTPELHGDTLTLYRVG